MHLEIVDDQGDRHRLATKTGADDLETMLAVTSEEELHGLITKKVDELRWAGEE